MAHVAWTIFGIANVVSVLAVFMGWRWHQGRPKKPEQGTVTHDYTDKVVHSMVAECPRCHEQFHRSHGYVCPRCRQFVP